MRRGAGVSALRMPGVGPPTVAKSRSLFLRHDPAGDWAALRAAGVLQPWAVEDPQAPFFIGPFTGPKEGQQPLPDQFAFRTPEGDVGVREVTGVAVKAAGADIILRYRLLPRPTASP